MPHKSMALTNMPIEIVNVQPLNPLISKCDAKVLYEGKNRNRSYISKAVANVMANSLPNIPIVGEYLEQIEDFGDHAEEMIIDSKGVRFRKRTVPYGVVPADTQIWWQWFHDDDGVDREYLMCQGYLWTGRYPETHRILEKGNGQSMELDGNSLKGQWATLQNETQEYFIIDEAIISALCILGENVEPCFESASVTAPDVVYSLNKDTFKSEFTQFMLDLKSALNSQEGGTEMPGTADILLDENGLPVEGQDPATDHVEDPIINDPVIDNPVDGDEPGAADDEFAKKKEEEDKKDNMPHDPEDMPHDPEDPEDKKKKKPSYTLEEVTEYQELLVQYNALQEQYNTVVAELDGIKPEFAKLQESEATRVKASKEAMIAKFNILDEEDLVDVRSNIDTYSLEDIEAKLSVIAVRKGVNFNLDNTANSDKSTEDPIISFNADSTVYDSAPAWIKAVEARKRK